MKSSLRILCGALLGSLSFSSSAALVSLVGSGLYSKPTYQNYSTTETDTEKLGYGGGLLVDFMVAHRVSFQLGALYQMRNFQRSALGITANSQTTFAEIPALLRFGLGSYLSIGVGGYYDVAIGKVKTSVVGGATSEASYKDQGLETRDYGVLASVALAMPIGKMTRLLIDGRYRYGLANQFDRSTIPGGQMFYRDMQVLAGFQFFFGGRGGSKSSK